jgi:P-type conjugative transfer protein TrbG
MNLSAIRLRTETVKAHRTVALCMAIVLAPACARLPPPKYYQAEPVPHPPRPPVVVTVPQPLPLPGQLQPMPSANRPPAAAPPAPCLSDGSDTNKKQRKRNREHCNEVASVLADANRKASQNPGVDGYFNAIQTYPFEGGALYQVYSAPMRLTMISLQPGEKIMGRPAAGDTTRWQMGLGKSLTAGAEQQHIFLKPSRAGLDTSMVITTDRRIYYLELHSFEQQYMAALSWRYPQDEIAQLEAAADKSEEREKAVTATVDLASAYFRYEITAYEGHPAWQPEQVFDDGLKTYIRFPKSMLNREAPALFVLSANNDVQLVNYRVRNEYYVVDRIFDGAELRLGQEKQEIVRIKRK